MEYLASILVQQCDMVFYFQHAEHGVSVWIFLAVKGMLSATRPERSIHVC